MKKTFAQVVVATLTLSFSFLPGTPAHATAGITNSIRWSQTNSTGFAWALENLAADDPNNYANFQKYYTTGVKLYDVIAAAGSTVTLQWKITNADGSPSANTPVTLALNPAYTYPSATLASPALDPTKNFSDQSPRDPTKTDNADIPLVTDANGLVTYSLTNNTQPALAEPLIPNDGTTVPSSSSTIFTQAQLYVGTFANTAAGLTQRNLVQATQDEDILEIHWETGAKAGAPVVAPAANAPAANVIRWDPKSSTGFSWSFVNQLAINSILQGQYFTPQVNFFDLFALNGTSPKVVWHVTDPKGKALANTDVTLVANPAYSAGTAAVTGADGTKIPLAFGGNQDGVDIHLTTDANGNVSYVFKNSDTAATAETPPGDESSPPIANVSTQLLLYTGVYSNYAARSAPYVVQKIQDVDILEIHWVTSLPTGAAPAAPADSGGIAPTDGVPSTDPSMTTSSAITLKPPTLSGAKRVGSSISASFASPKTGGVVTFQWYSCTSAGSASKSTPKGCSAITKANQKKLTLPKSTKGSFVRVGVTVTSKSGTGTVFSATSGKIA